MAHRRKGDSSYGDSQADIKEEIEIISELLGHPSEKYADALCKCGAKVFKLRLGEEVPAAVRTCRDCGFEHPIGDSARVLETADLEEVECECGSNLFEVTVGVALFSGTEDVQWIYVGCRCLKCEMLGSYGDWEIDFKDYRKLLSMV